MASRTRYAPGFTLLSQIDGHGLTYLPVGISVAIAKGDALVLASGYATLATTLQAKSVWISQSVNTAAEAVANGTIDAACIPIISAYKFMVPEEDNLLVLADVGNIIDLQSEDGIDNSDAVTLGYGFMIDEIDVSTAAVAANTYGYAIGHFEYVAAS